MKHLNPLNYVGIFASSFALHSGASAGTLAGVDMYKGGKEWIRENKKNKMKKQKQAEKERKDALKNEEKTSKKRLDLEKRAIALKEKELALEERKVTALEKLDNPGPAILIQSNRSSVQPPPLPPRNRTSTDSAEIEPIPKKDTTKTRCCIIM